MTTYLNRHACWVVLGFHVNCKKCHTPVQECAQPQLEPTCDHWADEPKVSIYANQRYLSGSINSDVVSSCTTNNYIQSITFITFARLSVLVSTCSQNSNLDVWECIFTSLSSRWLTTNTWLLIDSQSMLQQNLWELEKAPAEAPGIDPQKACRACETFVCKEIAAHKGQQAHTLKLDH